MPIDSQREKKKDKKRRRNELLGKIRVRKRTVQVSYMERRV